MENEFVKTTLMCLNILLSVCPQPRSRFLPIRKVLCKVDQTKNHGQYSQKANISCIFVRITIPSKSGLYSIEKLILEGIFAPYLSSFREVKTCCSYN